MATFNNDTEINSNNIYKFIEGNNLIEYYDKIINFLKINNTNLINIKNNNFNIIQNDDFYAYINNKKLNKLISYILSIIYKKYNYIDNRSINENIYFNINESLNNDGIYIYNDFINENICNNIIEKLSNKVFIKNWGSSPNNINLDNLTSGTNWIQSQRDILTIEEVQQIACDPFILNIAKNYLNCNPILIQTNLWISKDGSQDQSNLFHQDYDDVNFLKIFIYLNDVNEDNGPHCYVKGSLKNMITPNNYEPSQRLSDEYIYENYKENVIKICGNKGTMIIEDTNGFHKGTILKSGIRYMLQLEYGCSTKFLDGGINFINNLDKNENKILYNAKIEYPDSFFLYNFE